MSFSKLRGQLVSSFSLSELKTLCEDLDINYDVLPGDGLEAKARELIAYCQRHRMVPSLIERCRQVRPNVEWELPGDAPLIPGVPKALSGRPIRDWFASNRSRVALGILAAITLLLLLLNFAEVGPFSKTLVWTSLGVEALNAKHLARVNNKMIVLGGAHTTPTCDVTEPGLWFSDNNGSKWQPINIPDLCFLQGTASVLADIQAFALSPAQPQRIYVATSPAGLLRRDTPEDAWSFTGDTGLPHRRLFTAAADPLNADRIFVSLLEQPDEGTGLFVSEDAGRHWRRLDEQTDPVACATGAPFTGTVTVGALLTTSEGVLVGTGDPNFLKGIPKGLYLSRDGGTCWQRIDDGGTGTSQFHYRALAAAGSYIFMVVKDVWASTFALYRINVTAPSPRRELVNTNIDNFKALTVQDRNWFVATGETQGRVLTGSIDDPTKSSELPGVFFLCLPACDISLSGDTNSEYPLMLVRSLSFDNTNSMARVYRLQIGPWWKRHFPG